MSSSRHGPWVLALVATVLLTAGGCGDRDDGDRLVVAVSILPQAGLVERIAGERVRVVVLVQPGESPATYRPADRQVSEVARATAYLRIGVPFENGKWLDALRSAGGVRIVDVSEDVEKRRFPHDEDHGEDHAHEGVDPHGWLAPAGLRAIAASIADTLVAVDPEGADRYRTNLRRLHEDLDRLDAELRATLAPHRGRRIYVFHPTWGYLCDAYGLEQVAIEAEGKEPSEREITALLERARADGIRAIHVQPQIRSSAADAIARALGVEVRVLDPLARDPIENLRQVARILTESWR